MDRRRLLCVGVLAAAGIVGCARHNVVETPDAYTSAEAQAAEAPRSAQAAAPQRRPAPQEPRQFDAKPASLTQLADVQSQVALDDRRAQEDRSNAQQLAKQNYRHAMQLDPRYLPAYEGMARLCSDLGEHEQAVFALDSALARFPQSASLWYERGMVMGRMKQFDQALHNLHRAAQLEPGNAKYGKSVGLMLARLNRSEEGVAWLRRWMPEADARYNAARLMQHIGRADEEQRQLQLALAADPAHPATLAMLGERQAPQRPAATPALPGDEVRLAGHSETQPAPALKITIDNPAPVSSLPDRPAASPEPGTLPPAIAGRGNPLPLTPGTSGQVPESDAARARPTIKLGFEPNP
jgi:tetratricopeptide (TPR) repeat protein